MKKMKQLMEEIGFNPDASFEAKKAFIKHLIKEAHFQEVHRSNKNKLTALPKIEQTETPSIGEQLLLFPPTGTEK